MTIRHRHKVGDYLMRCDDSGEVHYRSELVKRWDGAWVLPKSWETRQPQEFVKSKNDPYVPKETRPETLVARPFTGVSTYIGATSTLTPTDNAAYHLFDVGIGQMIIGLNFVVR